MTTTTKTQKMHVRQVAQNSYLWWVEGAMGSSDNDILRELMDNWTSNGGTVHWVMEQ